MASDEKSTTIPRSLIVAVISLLGLGATAIGHFLIAPDNVFLNMAFLMAQTVVISIIIWQVCDPFADAAQWIGKAFRVPGSVRGATLDAIASSMPELFSGIFFVVVAVWAVDQANVGEASADGFGATIATCAGSAVYNMILIPAVCVIVMAISRRDRPTIDVDSKVISRDGMWFLCCEIILISFLFMEKMSWWMAIVLLLAYVGYVIKLYYDAQSFRKQMDQLQAKVDDGMSVESAIKSLESEGQKVSRDLANRFDEDGTEDDDEDDDTAGAFFGLIEIPLNKVTCWLVVGVTTLLAAGACYWLVEVTNAISTVLNIPIFFVAVIIAAAASSVPDTFLSIGSAQRGDDDGAVSNAFGSNIFDITICLSIPLLVGCYLNDWQPIPLTQNGEPIRGLMMLRILLCVFSLITLLVMWHRRQLTLFKACFLCVLYAIFILYAIGGSLGWFA